MTASTKELVTICQGLPPQKVEAVIDFARFLRQQINLEQESSGDAAWERIIAAPRRRPKLDAFVKAALADGPAEPLDSARL